MKSKKILSIIIAVVMAASVFAALPATASARQALEYKTGKKSYSENGVTYVKLTVKLPKLTAKTKAAKKINTYFTDVSDHSHLNALYSFCCRNLSIDRYFADVDNKLATLKETLEQLHDEQMETYKRAEGKIVKWVGVFALALTVFSALNDSYDYFDNFFDAESAPGTHALVVICIIVSVLAVVWRIVESIQKKYMRGSDSRKQI
jgi:hypothetical protein